MCPSLQELLAGTASEHAGGCTDCRAILDLCGGSTLDPSANPCGVAEVLLSGRATGNLTPAGQQALRLHLKSCGACALLVSELETLDVAEVLADSALAANDFVELSVVASDNYVRGAPIGRGGMGQIVRARDRRLGRSVAIKELLDERLRERFEHEARLTARLQHPAIVSVYEAGCWPSGAPFYAMKYVGGRPLDQVVAEMPTLAERLGLLANVTTVVEAIAYAHSERVVHRDLKPQNILIGPFGETVVIDWGLAKDLRAGPERGTIYRDVGPGLTAAGAGTPAYMPPEQARGEAPDERVDVYALGATLHHVLAGDRPDVRPLPEATPPDLRAIVVKAMARKPADRYPTAAELAGELKRFQNGQLVATHRYTVGQLVRRWLRRNRAIASVVTAAFVLLSATGVLGVSRIVAERDRAGRLAAMAESERLGAERLVDYMLGALRTRLEGVGKIELLAGVGKEVQAYYAGAVTDSEMNVGTLERRAAALMVLGQVDRQKGSRDDARADYDGARRLCSRAWALAPTASAGICAANADMHLGVIAKDALASPEAFAALKEASDWVDRVQALYPREASVARCRGVIADYLGSMRAELGATEEARRAYGGGVAVLERRIVEAPADTKAMATLASLRVHLGQLETGQGRPDVAITHFAAAADIDSRARELEPDKVEWRFDWATSSSAIVPAALIVGDFALASARLEPARAEITKLVASDPANLHWLLSMSFIEGCSCMLAKSLDHLDEARPSCRRMAEETSRQLEKDPEASDSAINFTIAVTGLAEIALLEGRPALASKEARRALDVALAWNRKQTGDIDWLRILADAEVYVAYAEHDVVPARIALASVMALGEDDVESVLIKMRSATAVSELGQTDDTSRRSLALGERARLRWPSVVPIQGELARTLLALARRADPAEAASLRARAAAIIEPLERRGALDAELRAELGLRREH